jgi:signal transduction histidine kinase
VFDHDEFRAILSNLSHELCRPLVSLRAGFDLLLGNADQPISADQRAHFQTMVGLCDDLLRLTRTYLEYAGLLQGSRPLCYGVFTISALIREIDRQFAPEAAARRVDWLCSLDGPDATVTTDASRCQQVFGNLVANALKYTPEGGRVRLQGRRDGDHWCVAVTDSGPGIPEDSREKVFEPFFRLPRDDRSGVDGNGLGLAICREMVGQMGGEIRLDSTPGEGTRVVVRLPADGGAPSHA